jgi:hypothetical protein
LRPFSVAGVFIVGRRAAGAHLDEEDDNVENSNEGQADRNGANHQFVLRRAGTEQRQRVLRPGRRCQSGGSEWVRMRTSDRLEAGLLRVTTEACGATPYVKQIG